MTNQDFKQEIERLKRHYGERGFSDEFNSLLWKNVEKIDAISFHETCSLLIGNQRAAPTLGDFSEALKTIAMRPRQYNPNEQEQRNNCLHCGDTGVIIAKNKISRRDVFFKCHKCDNPSQFRKWASHFLNQYELGKKYKRREIFDTNKLDAKCPWPESVKAVMHMIHTNQTGEGSGFKWALPKLGLTEETAWKLYEHYAISDFENPAAKELIPTAEVRFGKLLSRPHV